MSAGSKYDMIWEHPIKDVQIIAGYEGNNSTPDINGSANH